MGECFICGAKVVWENDFDAEDCGYTEEGIVHYYHCPKCNTEYEVFEKFFPEEK